jgi:hypothetical protein
MIVEERIYALHLGKVPEYTRLMESEGIGIQEPILGKLFGYFSTEFGPLNQVIHMWPTTVWGNEQNGAPS